ncbi:MAG: tol-pal system protein YbgF [Gallionella sp.]|jgi:tol-pal system protein YbgF|nr:tol-pal system protein YbgF [Gallionella sp.]
MRYRSLLLLVCLVATPASAGLFSDDEARQQIQQLEERVKSLEAGDKKNTQSMLDLMSQIDDLNLQIRQLRGQNEELAHGLQEAEKREKDFYVDLDSRLRRFETTPPIPDANAAATEDPEDPVTQNRAYEAAYKLYKEGSPARGAKAFQDFIQAYPHSVHVPNASYWLGTALLTLKDYEGALATFEDLIRVYPATPRAPDVMLRIAECQASLKKTDASKKTLKQIVAKYPGSAQAATAKKLLAAKK